MHKIGFVIPCYHSELTIKGVVNEIQSKMSEKPDFDFEIIAVNDCSPDNVLNVLREFAEGNTKLKVIDLAKNVGK